MTQLATVDAIERKIDRKIAGEVSVNPRKGLVVESLGQAMELAKLMAVSNTAVPKHLRGDPGACLAIAIQGYEWSINPFALANKSYVVNDRLAYESALYHAVVQRRAPIDGRIRQSFEGEGHNRRCRVWAELEDDGGTVEYWSPPTGTISPKNSPLWKNDPDQQLFYFSVRAFARRHFPDVMMGIYTVDELLDSPTDVVQGEVRDRGVAGLAKRINQQRQPSEGQHIEMETGDVIEGEQPSAEPEPPQEPVAEAPEPEPEPQAPPISPREQFLIQYREACEAVGLSDELDRMTRLAKWSVKAGVKGREERASEDQRKILFSAIESRSGFWA